MRKSARKAESDFVAEPTFTYGQVEQILVDAMGITDRALVSMRGRLSGLWRGGFFPDAPGRGKVIHYTTSNVYDWALALRLASFGLPPKAIANVVKLGTFDRFIEMIKERRRDKLRTDSHLLLLYFPCVFDVFEENADRLICAPYWANRLAIDGPDCDYARIDLTALKQKIDAAIASLGA